MIPKIVPKIFNGTWQLILSETLSCIPSQGLEIYVPINNEKNAIFKFIFKTIDNKKLKDAHVNQTDNILTFTLTNFLNSLGATLSDPFKFNIGKDNFLLQLYGISARSDVLCLTISIFKEKNV